MVAETQLQRPENSRTMEFRSGSWTQPESRWIFHDIPSPLNWVSVYGSLWPTFCGASLVINVGPKWSAWAKQHVPAHTHSRSVCHTVWSKQSQTNVMDIIYIYIIWYLLRMVLEVEVLPENGRWTLYNMVWKYFQRMVAAAAAAAGAKGHPDD